MAIRSFLLLFLFSVQLIAQRSTFYEAVQYESKFEPTPQRDSFRIEYPGNWLNSSGAVIYQVSEGNFIIGTNSFGDLAKAQHFVVNKPYYIHGAYFWIGALTGNTGQVHFDIWDYESKPSVLIQRKTLSVAQLKSMMLPADPTYIEFDTPVKVNKDYAIGIDVSDIGSATLGLVSSRNGDGAMLDLAWEKWDNNEWHTILFGWNLDLDIAIFPYVSDDIDTGENPDFSGGKGTLEDPYLIANADQLNNVRKYLSAHFRIIQDIELNLPPWNEGKGWLPIGNIVQPFRGSFDGQNFRVKNLYVNTKASDYLGLFGYLKGAKIQNLLIENAGITGHNYIGVISGYTESTTLKNIRISGEIRGNYYAGGLIGMAVESNIDNCHVTTNINASQYVGGIAGYIQEGTSIMLSSGMGNVAALQIAGGLVGMIGNSKPTPVNGPDGVVVVVPGNSRDEASRITLVSGNASEILRNGEQQASSVVKVNISGATDRVNGNFVEGEGFPIYSITFPINLEQPEENRLRVRVKMTDGSVLPVFGSYNPNEKTYTIYTFGLVGEWVLGVVSGNPVNKSGDHNRSTSANSAAILGWNTFEFEIIDDSDYTNVAIPLNPTDLTNHIEPEAMKILRTYHGSGFKPPKLLPSVTSGKFQLHMINSNVSFALQGALPFSFYLDPDQLNTLGGIYMYYPPEFGDISDPSTWKFQNTLSHEIFHAIQAGYNFESNLVPSAFMQSIYGTAIANSAVCYQEGTATIVGSSYEKYGSIGNGKTNLSEGYDIMKLNNSIDDVNFSPYERQDVFGFLSKRHFDGNLEFLGPLWEYIANESRQNDQTRLREYYRNGMDKFLRSIGTSLTEFYTDFAMQRLYIHEPQYLLRDPSWENPEPHNWFSRNFLTSFLLDSDYFKKWKSNENNSFKYSPLSIKNIESLASAAVVMELPDMVDLENKPDSIELKLSLSGNVNINQNLNEEGIRIVIIRALNEHGLPVQENAAVVLNDFKKPFKISIKDDVSHLVFIVINSYKEFKTTDLLLEHGVVENYRSINIFFEGNHNWEIAGDYIKPLNNPNLIEFIKGAANDENDDLQWNINEFSVEVNFQFIGLYSKLKINGSLSEDRKKVLSLNYFYEENIYNFIKDFIKLEDIEFHSEYPDRIIFIAEGADIKNKIKDIEVYEYSNVVNYPPESNYRKYLSTEFDTNSRIIIVFY
jgi:hypothetical protein